MRPSARDAVPEQAAHVPRRSRLKNIVGGSAGNLVEWFDWYVYSAFALYFAPVFFPKGDQTAQLLSTAAVFAVGFVMRPIGAWLMGIYADHRGRNPTDNPWMVRESAPCLKGPGGAWNW